MAAQNQGSGKKRPKKKSSASKKQVVKILSGILSFVTAVVAIILVMTPCMSTRQHFLPGTCPSTDPPWMTRER